MKHFENHVPCKSGWQLRCKHRKRMTWCKQTGEVGCLWKTVTWIILQWLEEIMSSVVGFSQTNRKRDFIKDISTTGWSSVGAVRVSLESLQKSSIKINTRLPKVINNQLQAANLMNIAVNSYMMRSIQTEMKTSSAVSWVRWCNKTQFLTHRDRDQIDAVSQTTFLNTFSRMKMNEFCPGLHWCLFVWFELTIFQHWLR